LTNKCEPEPKPKTRPKV